MSENITPLNIRQSMSATKPQQADAALTGQTSSYNFEIEQGLLGALMVNNGLYDYISDFLQAGHFYDPLHGKIYELISQMIRENEPATAMTLRAFFENDPQMEKKGGVVYLVSLEGSSSTSVNAIAWAHAIQNHAQRRDLIQLGQDIHQRAVNHHIDNPPLKQIEQAEIALYDIAERGIYESGLQSFATSLEGALAMAQQAYELSAHGGVPGLRTGFRDLDGQLGALRASDLIIIAGRPAMGKTALATNIAFNIARSFQMKEQQMKEEQKTEQQGEKNKKQSKQLSVGFFSLEMSAEQLSSRILADRANIQAHFIRQGSIRNEDLESLNEAAAELKQLPLYIDHTGAISLATLSTRARRLKRQKGLGLLVVDYLQLITTQSSRYADRRVQEIGEITQGLKALAKNLDIPVIALSQLSRQVESREDKRPQLSDLRESGAIEQDADIVLFLFREAYYLHRTKPDETKEEEFMKWQKKMEQIQDKAEIIIGKHRHGPTGMVELHFDRNYTRFSDFASPEMIAEPRE